MLGWIYRVQRAMADEKGAALAEWGLLVVLIAIVALVGVQLAGTELSGTYSEITSTMVEAST